MRERILDKFRILAGLFAVLGILGIVLVAGCSDPGRQQPPACDQGLEPLEIHVCVDGPEEGGLQGNLIWEGIRSAHGLNGALAGRRIDLIRESTGARTFDSLEAVRAFAREEGIDGAVLFRATRAFGPSGELSRGSGTFIGVVPSVQRLLDGGQESAVQVGCSLEERARTAALFASTTLGAADAMIVLDQEAPDSIVLSSMFSSAMIRLGGSISDVRILQGENADLTDVLRSVKEKNPDVIYMPYSEETSLPALELLQKQEPKPPVIVVNVPQEQRFLERGGERLEGVYLVTDHRPRSTWVSAAVECIRGVLRIPGSRRHEEALAVLGSDAYLTLLDVLQETEGETETTERASLTSDQAEPLAHVDSPGHSGRVYRDLFVCRVEAGFLQEPHLSCVESVDPSRFRSWR